MDDDQLAALNTDWKELMRQEQLELKRRELKAQTMTTDGISPSPAAPGPLLRPLLLLLTSTRGHQVIAWDARLSVDPMTGGEVPAIAQAVTLPLPGGGL